MTLLSCSIALLQALQVAVLPGVASPNGSHPDASPAGDARGRSFWVLAPQRFVLARAATAPDAAAGEEKPHAKAVTKAKAQKAKSKGTGASEEAPGAASALSTKAGAAASAEAAPEVSPKNSKAAIALTLRVQRFYEETKDFRAHFEQRYTYKVLGRSSKSSGEVVFKKPGLMRWDYKQPREKLFVIDGSNLWVYTPEDQSVLQRKNFTPDSLSSSITFLWGKGKLVEEFDLVLVSEDTLSLTPKTPQAGFSALRFVVDMKSGQVKESTVIDAQGNENHMVFSAVQLDTKVDDSLFHFTPPKGVSIQTL